MSITLKYLLLRLCGHALSILPAVIETLAVLPYGDNGSILDKMRVTLSGAVIISVMAFCLLKNILGEKIKSPSPWAIACGSFLVSAAVIAVATKLLYITLAWALGSLAALVPYYFANKLKERE